MGKNKTKKRTRRPNKGWLAGSSATQTICISFLLVIAVGTLLLTLPISSRTGRLGVIDAMFTATSATCVTGLIVRDTWSQFSLFGQVIILMLIQVGGLGLVTLTSFFALAARRRMGFRDLRLLGESVSADGLSKATEVLKIVIKLAAAFEAVGIVLLLFAFVPQFGAEGVWVSVFTAISAFCNAGFDLMGVRQQYSSLTYYAGNGLVNAVIVLLILIGGLGFLTWEDIKTNKLQFKKYRMQSKVILVTDLILVIVPTVIFYFGEFHGSQWGNGLERFWLSLFQAVTPRTAGFNTVDFGQMSEGGLFLMVMLMLIGGAPGSTAGGMKMTTIAVLLLSTAAVFRRKEDAQCFGRRIPTETVRYAAVVMLMYMVLCTVGGLFLCYAEGLPVLTSLFEAGSAIATVGLTLGVTPTLGAAARLVLIVLMYCGRVGGLTLVFAALSGMRPSMTKFPQEKITVG